MVAYSEQSRKVVQDPRREEQQGNTSLLMLSGAAGNFVSYNGPVIRHARRERPDCFLMCGDGKPGSEMERREAGKQRRAGGGRKRKFRCWKLGLRWPTARVLLQFEKRRDGHVSALDRFLKADREIWIYKISTFIVSACITKIFYSRLLFQKFPFTQLYCILLKMFNKLKFKTNFRSDNANMFPGS